LTRILAIDTTSAWCSVALSIADAAPLVRHQKASAGASQLLLPWVKELLTEASIELSSLDAIAVGVGPGAFTGVRLGVAVVQGLATAAKLPVLPVASLDAISSQLVLKPEFINASVQEFIVAVDARMGEVYWAKYQIVSNQLPQRQGEIHLTPPELVDLENVECLAGSAITEFGERLFASTHDRFRISILDPEIGVDAQGVLACAQEMWKEGLQKNVHMLEPLYIRNKVALTSIERSQQHV
jgi:tRNA threonylcarbamoyladenosine biosynthesis protein TsaB